MLLRLILLGTILITLLSSASGLTQGREMEAEAQSQQFSLITNSVAANCEVRGAWVKPYMISQAADRAAILQKITGAHLNTVFVLAPAVGDNRGWSSASSFSSFLNEAKNAGLSVHAWVISRERSTSGTADYTSQAEQDAQARWVTQLVSAYPRLDGVHFDYIRYDKYDVSTTTGAYAHLPRVDAAKTAGVSSTVQKAYQELKRLFPDKKLTAAVKLIAYKGGLSGGPYPTDGSPYFWQRDLPFHRENQQDALGWVNGGFIDGVMPMNYTMVDAHWNFDANHWKGNLGTNFSKVYMGLGWLTEAGEPDYGYDAPGVVRKIKYGRTIGMKGFSIFDLGDRNTPAGKDTELINALTIDSAANNSDAPFEQIVPSCLVSSTNPTPSPSPTATPTSMPQLPTSTLEPTSTPQLPTDTPEPTSDLPLTLAFDSPTIVPGGETFKVNVVARQIPSDGFYGAQLEISYDPALISVDNLQITSDLSLVVRNNVDAAAGKITLAASRQGRVSGLTGEVVLLSFDATAAPTPGTATFTLGNEKFGDAQAATIWVEAQDLTVTITADTTPEPTVQPTPLPTEEPTPVPTNQPTPNPTVQPTPLPTDEPTPEPTIQPTPLPTDEPTPQPTGQPDLTVLLGQVILTGRAGNNWSGTVVTVDDSGQNVTSDAGGRFSITNVSTGAHTSITADAQGYLPAVCSNPTLVSPKTSLNAATLLSGDINDDATVDAVDATMIGVSFGNTGPGFPADINQDGEVDIYDLILLSVNFGQGQQVWNCQG